MLTSQRTRAGFEPRSVLTYSSKNELIVTVDGDTDVGLLLVLPGWKAFAPPGIADTTRLDPESHRVATASHIRHDYLDGYSAAGIAGAAVPDWPSLSACERPRSSLRWMGRLVGV